MRRSVVIVAGVTVLVLIGFAVLQLKEQGTGVMRISSTQLVDIYLTDERDADKTYAGTEIEVSGVITEIQPGDQTIVMLSGNEMNQVQCVLKTGELLSPTTRVGDTLTLSGVCVGMLMDVIIRDCTPITN